MKPTLEGLQRLIADIKRNEPNEGGTFAEVVVYLQRLEKAWKGVPKRIEDAESCKCQDCTLINQGWNACVKAYEKAMK